MCSIYTYCRSLSSATHPGSPVRSPNSQTPGLRPVQKCGFPFVTDESTLSDFLSTTSTSWGLYLLPQQDSARHFLDFPLRNCHHYTYNYANIFCKFACSCRCARREMGICTFGKVLEFSCRLLGEKEIQTTKDMMSPLKSNQIKRMKTRICSSQFCFQLKIPEVWLTKNGNIANSMIEPHQQRGGKKQFILIGLHLLPQRRNSGSSSLIVSCPVFLSFLPSLYS